MIIQLGIETQWVEEFDEKSQKVVRRAMSFDEVTEYICENCHDAWQEVEIEIDKKLLLVCKACAKQITTDKLNDPDFIGNIEIQIL